MDGPHFESMLQLHLKANPREVVVGWYATSPRLVYSSALIQNHFASITHPFVAVHLTLSCAPDSSDPFKLAAYTHIGVGRQSDNCLFIPVDVQVAYTPEEQSALTSIQKSTSNPSLPPVNLPTDLNALHASINEVIGMIERVQQYVDKVLSKQIDCNTPEIRAVGRYLADVLGVIPLLNKQDLEDMFSSHLHDVLMVVYLSNAVRTQVEVSQRLAMAV